MALWNLKELQENSNKALILQVKQNLRTLNTMNPQEPQSPAPSHGLPHMTSFLSFASPEAIGEMPEQLPTLKPKNSFMSNYQMPENYSISSLRKFSMEIIPGLDQGFEPSAYQPNLREFSDLQPQEFNELLDTNNASNEQKDCEKRIQNLQLSGQQKFPVVYQRVKSNKKQNLAAPEYKKFFAGIIELTVNGIKSDNTYGRVLKKKQKSYVEIKILTFPSTLSDKIRMTKQEFHQLKKNKEIHLSSAEVWYQCQNQWYPDNVVQIKLIHNSSAFSQLQ